MSETTLLARAFPADYDSARRGFRAAAVYSGARLYAARHPDAKGPAGETLSMDWAEIGPDTAEAAILVVAGTHGVEAYGGSGVQTALFLSGLAEDIAQSGVKLCCLHAHNPFGFAWNRRVNEANVDLNRNYLVDWSAPPRNEGYDVIAHALAPATLSVAAVSRADAALDRYARRHGLAALQTSAVAGQYHDPKGLYYGGAAPSWSNARLNGFVRERLGHARRIAGLDLHSGLGRYGEATLISQARPGAPVLNRIKQWWGEPAECPHTVRALSGALDTAFPHIATWAETAFAALECGAFEPSEVFQATRAEAVAWRDRASAPQAWVRARQRLRDVFYPNEPVWKRRIWRRASALIAQAATRLDQA